MSRTFKGQVHVRLSPEMHARIAKEAFDKGTSISGIIAQSITAREVLKSIDPWKTIDEIWEANRGVNQDELESDIKDAIKAVRKKHRRG
jgi:hypothetical protein